MQRGMLTQGAHTNKLLERENELSYSRLNSGRPCDAGKQEPSP